MLEQTNEPNKNRNQNRNKMSRNQFKYNNILKIVHQTGNNHLNENGITMSRTIIRNDKSAPAHTCRRQPPMGMCMSQIARIYIDNAEMEPFDRHVDG